MGIYYSAGVMFGYSFSSKELINDFTMITEEQSHLERRWDPKTGKELPKVKVVDKRGGKVLQYKGEEVGYLPDLCELICEDLNCSYAGINAYDEEPDTIIFGLYPDRVLDKGNDYGRVSSGNSYLLKDVIELVPRLEELGKKLEDLGLDVGPIGVFSTMDVS